jgi:hypothetical protein
LLPFDDSESGTMKMNKQDCVVVSPMPSLNTRGQLRGV